MCSIVCYWRYILLQMNPSKEYYFAGVRREEVEDHDHAREGLHEILKSHIYIYS